MPTGKRERALRCYSLAAGPDPSWGVPSFNLGLGLHHKYDCNWQNSLRFNQRAAQLDNTDEGDWVEPRHRSDGPQKLERRPAGMDKAGHGGS